MLAALSVALQAMWPVAEAPPAESAKVVNLFIDACMNGSVRLSNGKGHFIAPKDVPGFADATDWGRRTLKETAVKFDDLPSTYLVVADYDPVPTQGLSKVCTVTSRKIRRFDAFRALLAGSENMEPVQTRESGTFWPEWTIDAPKLRYRKRMFLQEDHSVVLELRTYTTAGPHVGN